MENRFFSGFNDGLLNRLFKNTGILLSGTIISNVLGLVSLALTTHALGTHEFGILVLVSTYIAIIDKLVNFQSWQALIKYGSEFQDKKESSSIKHLIKVSTILDLSSALAGALIAFLLAPAIGDLLNWSGGTIHLAQIYSFAIAFNLDGVPTGVLRLFDRFKLFSWQKVVTSLFKVILVGIAFILEWGLFEFVLIWVFTAILGHLVLLFLGHRLLKTREITKWWQASGKGWYKVVKFTFWTNITSTFDLPIQQFDIILVSLLISVEATGIYKIIKKIAGFFNLIASPVYQVIYPEYTKQIAVGKYEDALSYARKTGMLLFLALFPSAVIAGITSNYWFPFIFDIEAGQWLWPLIIFLLIKSSTLGFIPIHPLFIALGYVKINTLITFISNIIYLITAYLGGVYIGLLGIVIAHGIQNFAVIIPKLKIIFKIRSSGNFKMQKN